jgi:hypothetical protein
MRKAKGIICILPDENEPLTLRGSCSNIQQHTPSPESYLRWHSWAERMSKTHAQEKCASCGLYVIWTPNKLFKPKRPRRGKRGVREND